MIFFIKKKNKTPRTKEGLVSISRLLNFLKVLIFWTVLACIFHNALKAQCHGRLVNPVTDICWKCLFPLRIGGVQIAAGGPDERLSTPPLCVCHRPGVPVPIPGIPVSFWEPVRLIDVTRTPYCLTNMGGISIGSMGIKGRGDVGQEDGDLSKSSFYHVHWYVYPVLYWLELLMDIVCLEAMSFDLTYLTELDPFWADDEMGAILNPEGLLFGNPIAQAACAADSVASTAHLPLDALFWCGGSWGSLYPFGGTVRDHEGGVQASSLLAGRFMAKLHREGLLWGYTGLEGMCGRYPMPIIKKSQYRLQMTYPIPQTTSCHPIGMNPVLFQTGKEFPFGGSDFGYLVFRKRDCCAL